MLPKQIIMGGGEGNQVSGNFIQPCFIIKETVPMSKAKYLSLALLGSWNRNLISFKILTVIIVRDI